MIGLPWLWDTVSINQFSRKKKMLYSLKKLSYNTPSPPHNSQYLSTMATFFSPQGGHCVEVQLYFKSSGKPCRQTSKLWKLPKDSLM